MTLKDTMNGPEWVVWATFVLFATISTTLLSGHGENLIAGYNTARKEEKDKINVKKLCRVVGAGMAVISVMILVMALGASVLPAYFSVIFAAIVFADCITVIVLANTICKK